MIHELVGDCTRRDPGRPKPLAYPQTNRLSFLG
jgi:hypothetical protein